MTSTPVRVVVRRHRQIAALEKLTGLSGAAGVIDFALDFTLRRHAQEATMTKPMTLEELGTPLARIYRGSGRLTGDVAGRAAPTTARGQGTDYVNVGDLTQDQFDALSLHEEHVYCHGRHADPNCPECVTPGCAE